MSPGCWAPDAPASRYPGHAVVLPILETHVIETGTLPPVHEDPFDRLLIAQARVEGLMAVSSDRHWPGYDVSLFRVG
jgi:PIN domain nuclease of toxin-antitoxin system